MLAPHCRRVPGIEELIPRYGPGEKRPRRSPRQLFELAQQAAIAAAPPNKRHPEIPQ